MTTNSRNGSALIKVEKYPNPDVLVFHLNTAISKSDIRCFSAPLQRYAEKDVKALGEVGGYLIRSVLKLPGVVQISISIGHIQVGKSVVFTWDNLAPKIISIAKECFDESLGEVAVVGWLIPNPPAIDAREVRGLISELIESSR